MNKIKKMLLLLLSLTFILSLTGCAEEPLNFEVRQSVMQSYSQAIIMQYVNVTDLQRDYYLSDGNELQQTAVKGFDALQTTDHVGKFISFETGEGSCSVSNGVDGKVVFSQICKYEHRNVNVKISYKQNKAFELDKEKLYNDLTTAASQYGMDTASYITSTYGDTEGLDMTSMEGFLESFLGMYYGEYPYIAEDCEVSAVYSKKELIGKAGVNTAIGMGVVFCVLIFISFVISLLKYLPLIFDADVRKKNAEKKKAQESAKKKTEEMIIANSAKSDDSKTDVLATKTANQADDSENLINDAELVAVITAAIYAATGSGVRAPAYTASNDKLVVRSIRRAKRS